MPPPGGMGPLLDALIEHVPPPLDRSAEPFSFLVVLTERDSFLGRVSTGRIATGSVAVGDAIKVIKHTGGQGVMDQWARGEGLVLSTSTACPAGCAAASALFPLNPRPTHPRLCQARSTWGSR